MWGLGGAEMMKHVLATLLSAAVAASSNAPAWSSTASDNTCESVAASAKVDCGAGGTDQGGCEAKGCCWLPAPGTADPWCFSKPAPAEPCFNLELPARSDDPPFDDASVARMSKYFLANFDINGSGAVIASPGDCPALDGCCPGDYKFHWMRDGALSIKALIETANVTGLSDAAVASLVQGYVSWVAGVTAGSAEPKWNITARAPYAFPWCHPQTDGPPLRALTLLFAMRRFAELSGAAWELAKADLDWIVTEGNFDLPSCDLWEEGTAESNLLWNRVAMRAALLGGAEAAAAHGDEARQKQYQQAAEEKVVDPWPEHTLPSGALSECPAEGQGEGCAESGKQIDGVVILALIHAGDAATPATDPAAAAVARTIAVYNEAFCGAYPVNRQGLPGVLYGRYLKDEYGSGGEGNPWVLITAALANLLYRAAISAAASPLSDDAVAAWRATFGAGFGADGAAFVAAGDSVLRRLRVHVAPSDDDHLYEQLDKGDGHQYNAKDITWSYAETLSALQQRRTALAAVGSA